ncbi:NUDIX domain-containing protein [Candidatus Njordibacter sp. Uisw_056]|jgi:colanic acid biosynthesis protein WcaH|uniref:GDP-mannose mannosyl hydrolase n=1 Tax=Candidatus Njordibacter sp. Uisw_056 TaxID=3230973 RepID=UPI003D55DBE5
MLDARTFKTVLENTPLVSIDLCLICNSQILLGKRSNEPLKGRWFTPGGRIHKNETWQDALLRIAEVELGLSGIAVEDFSLMGIWDHFYSNSVLDQNTSTHYVNLPHYAEFKSELRMILDDQHGEFNWFDLTVVYNDENFHPYMRNYAGWLVNRMGQYK